MKNYIPKALVITYENLWNSGHAVAKIELRLYNLFMSLLSIHEINESDGPII